MRSSKPGPAAALILACLSACGGDEPAPQPSSPEAAVATDWRVAGLLAPCSKSYHYDRDTGDALGILIDKLQNGTTESLRRAKDELAALGAPAVPEVVRLLNRNFEGKFGSAHIQNAIEVLSRIDDPGAHDALMTCLDHPRDVVRGAALRALSQGAALPEDFDRLLVHVQAERENSRKSAALALHAADPVRAAGAFLDWFEEGRYPDLWPTLSAKLLEHDPEPIARRCLELYTTVDPQLGLVLAAGALGTGDPGPRAMLDEYLRSSDGNPRLAAVSALLSVGRIGELVDLIATDPDPTIRAALLQQLADLGPDADLDPGRVLDELRSGLSDPSSGVRAVALTALLAQRESEAQARCLDQLDDGREALQELAGILPLVLEPDDPFVETLLERLVELDQAQNHLPLQRRQAFLQTLGLLPSPDAARYLREQGLAETEPVLNQRAHWWCTLQASNTGVDGRRYLLGELEAEADPQRRLDLIFAVSAQGDELGREFLMDFVQSDPDPLELVYAADRLVRMGPTQRVAPVLKRVTLRVEDQRARTALQCLLWKAY